MQGKNNEDKGKNYIISVFLISELYGKRNFHQICPTFHDRNWTDSCPLMNIIQILYISILLITGDLSTGTGVEPKTGYDKKSFPCCAAQLQKRQMV